MASTRPAQAAAIVPVPGRPVSFQTPARSIRPPSSGSPGSRLNTPTSRLATISWSVSTRAMPVGWTTSMASQPRPARPRDSSGPAPETRNSLPGVCGSSSISEKPPSGYSRIRRTGRPKARATAQWLSSWTSTETYSSSTNAVATR